MQTGQLLSYIEKRMAMEPKIKRIKRVLEHKGSILDIYSDYMELPNGKVEKWDFVSHRKGAAAVVAVTDEGKLLLVRQYRNALERMTLELPAGARDTKEEDTKDCAVRELEEETGYHAGRIEKLLSLKTTVAFCDELVDVYLATELHPGKQHFDEAEDIEVETWELPTLCDMIYAGRIQDAKTVAGILAYANELHNQ